MIIAAIFFWLGAALLLFTHLGYPVVLWLLDSVGLGGRAGRVRGPKLSEIPPAIDPDTEEEILPTVSLIVAAYNEEAVIEAKVENALALEYPRELLQVIVASDGSSDRTVEIARAAGADLVLDLPRGGKIAAQNAAAEQATGNLLAFSDANSSWEPSALGRLIEPFRDERVGYVCGQVQFTGPEGGNLEGVYWRYEMKVREMESDLAGVTAGNGAIYAVRASAYIRLEPSGSHDLSFPFALAKRGLASLYRPRARATEKLVPSLDGELARKRRMMIGLWDIVVGEGMIEPRGYSPLYLFELVSHRLLRYLSPALHLVVFLVNLVLLGDGWVYTLAMLVQLLVVAGSLLARWVPILPFRVARYYVEVTLSIALGLWDRWRQGPPAAWEKAEGTR